MAHRKKRCFLPHGRYTNCAHCSVQCTLQPHTVMLNIQYQRTLYGTKTTCPVYIFDFLCLSTLITRLKRSRDPGFRHNKTLFSNLKTGTTFTHGRLCAVYVTAIFFSLTIFYDLRQNRLLLVIAGGLIYSMDIAVDNTVLSS